MKKENEIPVYQLHEIDGQALGVSMFDFFEDTHTNNLHQISTPHRHDHYCCFMVEHGSIELYIDFKPVLVNKTCLLVSHPGQVHQFITDKKCQGRMLIFDAKLADESARTIIEDSLGGVALLTLNTEDHKCFENLFQLIDAAVNAYSTASFRTRLLRSLLDAFIYQAAIIHQSQEDLRVQDYSSRNIDITKKFRQLVKSNFKTIKKPSEYAEKMNFSASYLNDTVKVVTGFPLTYFIQQEIISEAQRLLYYSDISVKEIAYDLGFEDDKYFIRLFGKVTGMSPANFRKNKLSL